MAAGRRAGTATTPQPTTVYSEATSDTACSTVHATASATSTQSTTITTSRPGAPIATTAATNAALSATKPIMPTGVTACAKLSTRPTTTATSTWVGVAMGELRSRWKLHRNLCADQWDVVRGVRRQCLHPAVAARATSTTTSATCDATDPASTATVSGATTTFAASTGSVIFCCSRRHAAS